MVIRIIKKSHVIAVCVVVSAVFCCSCNIRGFKDKPYRTPWVIVDTPTGIHSGDVTLTYRLIEVDGTGADISLQYSTDSGTNWQTATAKGGSGTTDVKGVRYPGIGRTIVWDTAADAVGGLQTCNVKIVATKSGSGTVGTPGITDDFQVDNPSIPAISWLSKPDGTVRQVPLTFTWKLDTPAVPIANYYYGLDEDPPTSTTLNTSVTIPAPSNGSHTFRVLAQSTFGFNSSVLTAAFTCDNAAANSPPTVDITSGPSGIINQNFATFTWQGYDVDGVVAEYEYDLDCSGWISRGLQTDVTLTSLSSGNHAFQVRCRDGEGLYSDPATRGFFVDPSSNEPPTVLITSGPSGDTTDNTPVFTYTGSDTDGSVTGYYVSIDIDPPTIWTVNTTWDPSPLGLGPHTFFVQAVDDKGERSAVASRSFNVILSPPITVVPCSYLINKLKTYNRDNLIFGVAASNSALVVVNVATRSISNTIPLGGRPKDIDISKDENFAYITLMDTSEIVEVNLSSYSISRRFALGVTPENIACGRAGRVYFADTGNYIHLLNTDNGSVFSTEDIIEMRSSNPWLCTNKKGDLIYLTEQFSTGTETFTIKTDVDDRFKVICQAQDCSGSNSFIALTEDETRLFYNAYCAQAGNIRNTLGRVDEIIFAITRNGNLVAGETTVFHSSSFTPALNISGSKVMAVAENYQELFVYMEADNEIQIIDLSGIPANPTPPAAPTPNVSKIMADPFRDVVYALDNVSNTLMFFNADSLALEKTIFVGPRPGDMDIDRKGELLYVACWGARGIFVVDLATREKTGSFYIANSNDDPRLKYNITCGREGRLYIVEGDQQCNLLVYDLENNRVLTESLKGYREPDIIADPTGRYLYLAESDPSSPPTRRCYKLDISCDLAFIKIDASKEPSDAGRIINADPFFQYVFLNTGKLDTGNLSNIVTVFPESIWSVSLNGDYAVGLNNIYYSATGATVKPTPISTILLTSNRAGDSLVYYDNSLPGLGKTNYGAGSDNLPPTVTLTTGPSGTIEDETPSFTFSGSDPDGFVAGYFVSVDDFPPSTWVTGTTWVAPAISDHSHTFFLMAQDNDGANSNLVTRIFSVMPGSSNSVPTVTITSGPSRDTFDNTPTFTFSGQDTDGTIAGYFVGIDENPPSAWLTGTTWTTSALTFGPHDFFIIAQDNDGANSGLVSCSFMVIDGISKTIYVDAAGGDNSNDGLSWGTAVETIRKAIDLADANGTMIILADGTYKGEANWDLTFAGKDIYLKSENGSESCILSGHELARALMFNSSETSRSVVEGLQIQYFGMDGAIVITDGSDPMIINCVFRYNGPGWAAGSIKIDSASPKIDRCLFEENNADYGGGIACFRSNSLIKDCIFRKNIASSGGGIYCESFSNATIIGCIIEDNDGGGLFVGFDSSPLIKNCRISYNSARFGGAIHARQNGNVEIVNCVLKHNRASSVGGACYFRAWVNVSLIGCVITGNLAEGDGGAIGLGYNFPDITVINSTIAYNVSLNRGGGISCDGMVDAVIANTIIWDNYGNNGSQIYVAGAGASITLANCDYRNKAGDIVSPVAFSETGCINLDPLFAFGMNGDVRLRNTSPCIDAGDNTYPNNFGLIFDVAHKPRIVDGAAPWDGPKVDIGAYEYQP